MYTFNRNLAVFQGVYIVKKIENHKKMNPAEAEQQSPHQEISEVDADRINAISSICNSFDEIPPELVQIAKDNQDLKTVAELSLIHI